MNQGNSTLIAHNGSTLVTLAELNQIDPPKPMGPRHYPVAHRDLVAATRHELEKVGLTPYKEKYAVGARGSKLFATWDLEGNLPCDPGSGRGLAFGFRHGNDQSLAIEMVAGARVFVCDNMAFSGDAIILHRMHTKHVSLYDEVGRGVTRLLDKYSTFAANMARLENEMINDQRAKELLVDAFMRVRILAPKYLPSVYDWYFRQGREHPEYTDVAPRSVYGLLNAFTRTIKDVESENVKHLATARVGRFFGLRSDVKDAIIGDVSEAELVAA